MPATWPWSPASARMIARAGDREAFRILVERHSRSAFRLACRLTGHEQDAEDIVQETFLKAFRLFGRVELARKETDPAK